MSFTVFRFKGGIHPPDNKEPSKNKPITPQPPPTRLTVPLLQHIGGVCTAVVQAGQPVRKGEVIGAANGRISVPVHAPVSGMVKEIGAVQHASGTMVPAVIIENDYKETWIDVQEAPRYMDLSPELLCKKIFEAGIVGMGGASFPAHAKLSPPQGKKIDTVIINGVECEPYLTADYRLMMEKPHEVIEGTRIIMKAAGVTKGYIGIEANKEDAAAVMRDAAGDDPSLRIRTLRVKYPQGAEKMLIKALTNRKVPPRMLPLEVGVVVHNVATAAAVYNAVRYGKPLVERVVTVTGDAIAEPKNIAACIGTPVADLIRNCGGFRSDPVKVLLGGPLMGQTIHSTDMPIVKGTGGILALSRASAAGGDNFGPCIRCGRCIDACPMGLMPSILGILAERFRYEEAAQYHAHDCFECGSCAYVCPAQRPLVHLVKTVKSMVKP